MRDVFGIAHAVWVSSSFGSIDRGDKDDILYNHGCYFIISSIAFYIIKSQLVLLHPILSCPTYPTLSDTIVSYIIYSILILSCPILFYLILFNAVLSFSSNLVAISLHPPLCFSLFQTFKSLLDGSLLLLFPLR